MSNNSKNMGLFYELVQVALGQRVTLSRNPSDTDWDEHFRLSQKQTIAGAALVVLDYLSQAGIKFDN